jgi:hypothetical protein
MNVYEIIKLIKTHLAAAAKERSASLYGAYIETDPYRQLENSLPFILIEDNNSALAANQQGYVYEYLHSIDLTCVVKADKEERDEYKRKAVNLAECTVKELQKISDFRFKIIPKEMVPGEVIIGSLKCSAIKITIEVRTLFIED